MRIKCFGDWCTDLELFNRIKNVYLNGDCVYKNLQFVNDDSFTHAIIFNKAMPVLNIPKENVIGFAQEPLYFLRISQQFIQYVEKNVKEYYLGDPINHPLFISGYSFLFHNSPEILTPKKGRIAMWCSWKKETPGHKYRHTLVQKILESKLDIDIWGNGCKYYEHLNDNRIKGEFIDEPYKDYEYCISIENFITHDYISEKILNCFVYNTVPIYLGAKNLEKYFGDCCIRLTGDVNSDIKIIEHVTKKDLTFARKQLFEGDCYFPEWLSKKLI